ncbi:MAG: hypothetical protein WCO65_02050 [bacterium]
MDTEIKNNNKSLHGKISFFTFRVAPVRHFRNLVIVCILIFFAIAAYHGRLLYEVTVIDPQLSSAGQAIPIPLINEKKLETVLGQFTHRAQIQASALGKTPAVVDPSK